MMKRPCSVDLRCPRCESNRFSAKYWPVVPSKGENRGRVIDRWRLRCKCGHAWHTTIDPVNEPRAPASGHPAPIPAVEGDF